MPTEYRVKRWDNANLSGVLLLMQVSQNHLRGYKSGDAEEIVAVLRSCDDVPLELLSVEYWRALGDGTCRALPAPIVVKDGSGRNKTKGRRKISYDLDHMVQCAGKCPHGCRCTRLTIRAQHSQPYIVCVCESI